MLPECGGVLQGCPPVDLLVRTSGESRLSDFLLFQSSHALLHFSPVLWPDFSFQDLLTALICYQRSFPHLSQLRQQAPEGSGMTHQRKNPQNLGTENGAVESTAGEGPRVSISTQAGHDVAKQHTGSLGRGEPPEERQGSVGLPSEMGVKPSQQGGEGRPAGRSALDRRKREQKAVNLDTLPLDESALFLKQENAAASQDRSSQLRAAGIAGEPTMLPCESRNT